MIKYGILRQNLYDWIRAQVSDGVKVIHSDQNQPAPKVAYVVIRILSMAKVGNGQQVNLDDETGIVQVIGVREVTVGIQAFGDSSMDELELIVSSLDKQTVRDFIHARGLAFITQLSDVTDITGIMGPRREKRATVDLSFRLGTPYGDDEAGDEVGIIEHVQITNTGTGDVIVVNPPIVEE